MKEMPLAQALRQQGWSAIGKFTQDRTGKSKLLILDAIVKELKFLKFFKRHESERFELEFLQLCDTLSKKQTHFGVERPIVLDIGGCNQTVAKKTLLIF
ncbi:hypothetical protein [Mesorhizobium sp. BE184]|uniref:hypothetical protein n=1 Tax=Mesorhizobium sp. BE184 TaxID=2817714 RepID=UPI002862D919|nr:hypothetical protein [Mesorhizobium sp. BE184]MDR7033997.1 hypothetical protein [Mesorhizobium sp. BE184]